MRGGEELKGQIFLRIGESPYNPDKGRDLHLLGWRHLHFEICLVKDRMETHILEGRDYTFEICVIYTLEICITMGWIEMGILEIRISEICIEICIEIGRSEIGIFGIASSGSTSRWAWSRQP